MAVLVQENSLGNKCRVAENAEERGEMQIKTALRSGIRGTFLPHYQTVGTSIFTQTDK